MIAVGQAAHSAKQERSPLRPWRVRGLGQGKLHVDNAGRFAFSHRDLREAIDAGALTGSDRELLERQGLLFGSTLSGLAHGFAVQKRRFQAGDLDYLILVPTLRCNLACTYCQVSRAAEDAVGYDWSAETLQAVIEMVSRTSARHIKIEFQGGEPTLRCDLIAAVMEAVPAHVEASFVICSNLQNISPDALALFDREDVSISTSLDGSLTLHSQQRQQDGEGARVFFRNLDSLLSRYGPDKISALPTINPVSPPDPDALIEVFANRGFASIYLRPINYQGFARKRHADSRSIGERWLAYHEAFIRRLIHRNWEQRESCLEETYFSLLLRRIFRPGENRHVDLRNPSPFGRDYVVIDYDGIAYPTDEARMLTRSGVIDLAIGDVRDGWNTPACDALNAVSTSDGDPDCEACVYQPFCGRDIVDDISRYGTIDIPRRDTEFCKRHIHLFDLAFELIHSADLAVQYSLCRWLGLGVDELPVARAP